jgi:cytochrome c556
VRGAGSASAPEIDGVVSLQKDIQAKAKVGNTEAIAANAETIAINAMHIPILFPAGSLAEKSRAKPEIWQKWTEFEADATQAMAEKLRDAAQAKNAEATRAVVRDFQKQTCDTCHTPSRAPPRRS